MQKLDPLPFNGGIIENHVISLPLYCAYLCEIECCGIDACDFSPIHIASYCLSRNSRFPLRVAAEICSQIETLRSNYGETGASARGKTIVELNAIMSDVKVESFCNTMIGQTAIATKILKNYNGDYRQPIFA